MPTRVQVYAWMALWGAMVPTPAVAQDRTEREVVELIELIVRDGPQATALRAETEVTRREQLARLTYPNPGVSYSREGAGFTEFLQVEQALPLFGTRAALSRAGVAATAAAEAERDGRLWQFRADAAALVVGVLAHQARLDASQSTVRDIERLIEVLRIREREGEGSRFDRLRAEQELADARQAAVSAAVAVADARTALNALMPRGVVVARVTGALYRAQDVASIDALASRAVATRAELRALQRTAERASHEADAAKRARLPAPTIVGGMKRADEGRARRGGVFGVTVSLPVFDAGGRDAARWSAERTRAEAQRTFIEQRIRAEIGGAAEALTLRQQALSSAPPGAAGGDLAQIAEVAYREGEMGILQLIDAVRTASRARLREIEMRLDARLAQIALERAVGDVLWP